MTASSFANLHRSSSKKKLSRPQILFSKGTWQSITRAQHCDLTKRETCPAAVKQTVPLGYGLKQGHRGVPFIASQSPSRLSASAQVIFSASSHA